MNFQLGELDFGCDLEQSSNFALLQEVDGHSDLLVSDLHSTLGLTPEPTTPETRAIIYSCGAKTYVFPVSKIHGIINLPFHRIFPLPPILAETVSHPGIVGFARIGEKLILLLDLEKIILFNPEK